MFIGGNRMQKQIEKIELLLENCEIITVEGKHIGDLQIENIVYSINRMACNYIAERFLCQSFSMSIHRDSALNTKMEFTLGEVDEERNPIQRIHDHKDIVSVHIHFSDGIEKHIYVKWDGESEYENKYQDTHINNFGDLFIVVDKDKKVKDIFNLDEIEDADRMSYIWNIYS